MNFVDMSNREEMQSLFDPHIDSMLRKIWEQLDFVGVKAFGNPQVVSYRQSDAQKQMIVNLQCSAF